MRTELAAAKQRLQELSNEMATMRTILASLPDLRPLAEDAGEATRGRAAGAVGHAASQATNRLVENQEGRLPSGVALFLMAVNR